MEKEFPVEPGVGRWIREQVCSKSFMTGNVVRRITFKTTQGTSMSKFLDRSEPLCDPVLFAVNFDGVYESNHVCAFGIQQSQFRW